MLITITVLVVIYFAAKGISDVLSFRYDRSIFKNSKYKQWLDPRVSHVNKYKNGVKENGAKFFGSTTMFVFLTDAWHMLSFIRLRCLILIATLVMHTSLLQALLVYIILSIIGAGVFNSLYDYVLLRKPVNINRNKL